MKLFLDVVVSSSSPVLMDDTTTMHYVDDVTQQFVVVVAASLLLIYCAAEHFQSVGLSEMYSMHSLNEVSALRKCPCVCVVKKKHQ